MHYIHTVKHASIHTRAPTSTKKTRTRALTRYWKLQTGEKKTEKKKNRIKTEKKIGTLNQRNNNKDLTPFFFVHITRGFWNTIWNNPFYYTKTKPAIIIQREKKGKTIIYTLELTFLLDTQVFVWSDVKSILHYFFIFLSISPQSFCQSLSIYLFLYFDPLH